MRFIIQSQKYGTFTEAARTNLILKNILTTPLFLWYWERWIHQYGIYTTRSLAQHLLWEYVQKYINIKRGYLIADDTILDKPRGPKIEGVGFHYSGKHKRSVRGWCLVSLVWTDGKHVFPVDFRIYNKDKGITKNEHLRDMLKTARNRGFTPKMVMFDSWYSARETLLLLQSWSWKYMVGIKSNRVLL